MIVEFLDYVIHIVYRLIFLESDRMQNPVMGFIATYDGTISQLQSVLHPWFESSFQIRLIMRRILRHCFRVPQSPTINQPQTPCVTRNAILRVSHFMFPGRSNRQVLQEHAYERASRNQSSRHEAPRSRVISLVNLPGRRIENPFRA